MDPETILNEYIGSPITPTLRDTINVRMTQAAQEARAATVNTNVFSSADMNMWINAATQQMYGRVENPVNPAGEIIMDYPNDLRGSSPSRYAEEMTRRYTFNHTDANAFIHMEPPEMVNVSFVEITGNPTSEERPIQVMTGKMRVEKGRVKFFEDVPSNDIKDHLINIVKKIMFPDMFTSLTTSGHKWACNKPGKSVDILKEMLDETVSDVIQATFKLQNKLRSFQYIKG